MLVCTVDDHELVGRLVVEELLWGDEPSRIITDVNAKYAICHIQAVSHPTCPPYNTTKFLLQSITRHEMISSSRTREKKINAFLKQTGAL